MAKIAKNGQNRCQNGQMLLLNTFHFIILDFGLKTRKKIFSTIFDHIDPIPGQTAPFCNISNLSRIYILMDNFPCFLSNKNIISTLLDHFDHIPGQTAPYYNFCYVSREGVVLIEIFWCNLLWNRSKNIRKDVITLIKQFCLISGLTGHIANLALLCKGTFVYKLS